MFLLVGELASQGRESKSKVHSVHWQSLEEASDSHLAQAHLLLKHRLPSTRSEHEIRQRLEVLSGELADELELLVLWTSSQGLNTELEYYLSANKEGEEGLTSVIIAHQPL